MDDPQVRRPDITRARQILGWEPEIDLEEGLRRWLQALGRGAGRGLDVRRARGPRRGRRRLAALAATAPPAHASRVHARRDLRRGADALRADPTTTFAHVRRSCTCRRSALNLYWGGTVRRREARGPAHPTDPDDPAYDWSLYDRAVDYAAQDGVQVLFSIYGTPSWANGGKAPNVAPTHGDRPAELRVRRGAALQRHLHRRRTASRSRPVRDWLAWNEPNNPVFLTPQYKRVGGTWVIAERGRLREDLQRGLRRRPRDARRAASASPAAAPAPRGNNDPSSSRPSVSPLAFLRAVEEGRAEDVRRLGAPPVLRDADRHADLDAGRTEGQRRRLPSRSGTSAR